MDLLKIDDIMDDGIIFLWVTKIIGKRCLTQSFNDREDEHLKIPNDTHDFNESQLLEKSGDAIKVPRNKIEHVSKVNNR